MKQLTAMLLAVFLLVVSMQSGSAKDLTIKDLALQAGAGYLGYSLGGLIGGVTSTIASLIPIQRNPMCGPEMLDSDSVNQSTADDKLEHERAACVQFQSTWLILQGYYGAALGKQLGALSGVLLAAKAQGHDGSVFVASVALMLSRITVATMDNELIYEPFKQVSIANTDGDPLSLMHGYLHVMEERKTMGILTTLSQAIIVIAAVMLGYHLF